MAKIKVNMKGDVQDIATLHDHLQYHTKKITDLVWIKQPEVRIIGDAEAEFTVVI